MDEQNAPVACQRVAKQQNSPKQTVAQLVGCDKLDRLWILLSNRAKYYRCSATVFRFGKPQQCLPSHWQACLCLCCCLVSLRFALAQLCRALCDLNVKTHTHTHKTCQASFFSLSLARVWPKSILPPKSHITSSKWRPIL